ncbi:hypothetical protein pdam_00020710 [Pocillopora damicornis]|uniref:Uncharacterized protein n=1 Tax=Pocillopora damicornis TaxID=46731 RepID=A0A3M6TH99_POCDA|nr:hypothetical protein pdam_00020710 [Pocillopora damicornis]
MHAFKSMNGLAPPYLMSDFTQAKKYHTYNTRHRDLIRLPLAKSTKCQGSFRYNGGCTFNNLSKAIRSLESLKTFKTDCKRQWQFSGYKYKYDTLEPEYIYVGNQLKAVSNVKDIGIHIISNISWNLQTNRPANKANSLLQFIINILNRLHSFEYFTFVHDAHHYELTIAINLNHYPQSYIVLGTLFFINVVNEWNNLPKDVADAETMNIFKKRLRCHFTNQGSQEDKIYRKTLFLVYINELPSVPLYADNTVLCFAKEPCKLESKLNADLYNTTFCLKANRLTLNLSKTKSMLLGSNRKLFNISLLSLSIFDCELDCINRFKY